MRKNVLLPLALVTVLALVVVLIVGDGGARQGGGFSRAPANATSGPPAPVSQEPPARAAPAGNAPEVRAALELAQPAEELAPASTAKTVVLGRVADEDEVPIPEARVRLAAYRVWAEGVDVPRLEGRYDMRGFEVLTDAGGGFRLEGPVPTAERIGLTIVPGRYHAEHRMAFAADSAGPGAPLVEGTRDLGEIRLATTGAIAGRVTDQQGTPLGGARLSIGPTRNNTYGIEAFSEADGSYLLPHARTGTYGVNAKLEGYISEFREPVTVLARRDTLGVDFALARAPTIEGRVVDPQGHPLAGARLWGWPTGGKGGSGAGATSGADGGFVVSLPQEEPYTLGAKLDGYLSWGNEHDYSAAFAPGTRELEVVLQALARTRFVVIDESTGAPIERFGLEILADNGSRSTRSVYTSRGSLPQVEHPGGVFEVTAREGIDLYHLLADGYQPSSGDVEHDSSAEPVQTVRLRRGSGLRGRVLRDGAALEGARIEVARLSISGRMLREAAALEGALADVARLAIRPGGDQKEEYSIESNSTRSTRTDAEGRFELFGLHGWDHHLQVTPAEGAPLVVVPLAVPPDEVRDLGDLNMLPGASIAGEVLLPAGVRHAGLEVQLGDRRSGVRTLLDRAGRFRFDDLAATRHVLQLGERPGEVAAGERMVVELAPGETRRLTIDARDRGVCEVKLAIVLDGLSAADRQVELVHASGTSTTLGRCDDAGEVRGFARASGEARVRVRLANFRGIEHPEPVLLAAGERVTRTLRFEFATLSLRLPPGVALPGAGRVRVELDPLGSAGTRQEVSMYLSEGLLPAADLLFVSKDEIRVGGLFAGTYRLTLELTDGSHPATRQVTLPGGHQRMEAEAFYRASAEITLATGETSGLQLE